MEACAIAMAIMEWYLLMMIMDMSRRAHMSILMAFPLIAMIAI